MSDHYTWSAVSLNSGEDIAGHVITKQHNKLHRLMIHDRADEKPVPVQFIFILLSFPLCLVLSLSLSLSPPPVVVSAFTEAVRLSDPGLHQALHRPQLAAEAREGSLSQRPPGERGQGTNSQLVFGVFLHIGHLAESRVWLLF